MSFYKVIKEILNIGDIEQEVKTCILHEVKLYPVTTEKILIDLTFSDLDKYIEKCIKEFDKYLIKKGEYLL